MAFVTDSSSDQLSKSSVSARYTVAPGGIGSTFATFPSFTRRIAAEIPAYSNIRPDELEGGRLLRKGDFIWGGVL